MAFFLCGSREIVSELFVLAMAVGMNWELLGRIIPWTNLRAHLCWAAHLLSNGPSLTLPWSSQPGRWYWVSLSDASQDHEGLNHREIAAYTKALWAPRGGFSHVTFAVGTSFDPSPQATCTWRGEKKKESWGSPHHFSDRLDFESGQWLNSVMARYLLESSSCCGWDGHRWLCWRWLCYVNYAKPGH